MKRILSIVIVILVVSLAFEGVTAQTGKVDPRVLEDTANGAVGHFIVVLKSQAATRALGVSVSDSRIRTHLVFNALRDTANVSQPAVRAQLDSLGAKHRSFFVVNAFAVEGNRAVVDALASRADVLLIEPDRVFRVPLETADALAPNAPTGIEWNISKVGAPSVWAHGYTGQGIVFANADTGVQWDHPALKSHYRGWNGTTANHNYNWYDAIQTSLVGGSACGYALAAPCDDYPHGTHAMGTGIGDDGAGNQIGVAPGAKWIACRNMDRGYGRPSTYIACLQFLLAPTDLSGNNPNPDLHADVISNSYGCPIGPPPYGEDCTVTSMQDTIANLRTAGIFMSVSAGNSGSGCSSVTDPPAIFDASTTIGATNINDDIVSFSSRGPVTISGTVLSKPDLVAPGLSIRSSMPTNNYQYDSGTSMAAPHVAGVVALLWSAFPQLRRHVDETESILEQSAVHLTTTQGCGGDTSSQVPNNVYGYGRVDVNAAYDLAVSMGYALNRFYYFPFLLNDAAP
ncbi:MAG: S8 family serine peptidase [Chloroflexi bacterium]|nr:S8 family serine peptidase [Chloroflexota bacterium]